MDFKKIKLEEVKKRLRKSVESCLSSRNPIINPPTPKAKRASVIQYIDIFLSGCSRTKIRSINSENSKQENIYLSKFI
jgi:hypothetical protein